jgi:hypothetical protein
MVDRQVSGDAVRKQFKESHPTQRAFSFLLLIGICGVTNVRDNRDKDPESRDISDTPALAPRKAQRGHLKWGVQFW